MKTTLNHWISGTEARPRDKVITSRWPEPTESQVDLGFPRKR